MPRLVCLILMAAATVGRLDSKVDEAGWERMLGDGLEHFQQGRY